MTLARGGDSRTQHALPFLVMYGDETPPCGTPAPAFARVRRLPERCSALLPLDTDRCWHPQMRALGMPQASQLAQVPWQAKLDKLVWRGVTTGGGLRRRFVQELAPLNNVDVKFNRAVQNRQAWTGNRGEHLGWPLTRRQLLAHKFVLSLEGNADSSGLKWMLRSNSVVVMPKPTYETWLMEGLLRPYVHYLPLDAPQDAPALLRWARANDAAVRQIVANAQDWVQRILDDYDSPAVALLSDHEHTVPWRCTSLDHPEKLPVQGSELF